MTCKNGVELSDCRDANTTLVQLGQTKLSCRSCTLDETSQEVFSKADTHAAKVRRWVDKMGFPAVLLDVKPGKVTGFRCPIIEEPVVASCALAKCAFHIDYPWASNCLLAYLHQQGVEALTTEEVAYLYQRPVEHVKEIIDGAISKLRSSAIDIQAADDSSLAPQFRYFVTTNVCIVCESLIEDEEIPKSLTIQSINAVYCSKDCKEERHPRVVELEVEKGLPITVILEWTFRRYKTATLAEQALGMPRWLLQTVCQRFLERPLDYYFSDAKVTETKPVSQKMMLIRRAWTNPAWVTSMVSDIRPITSEIRRRFGPVTVQLTSLRQQLGHLMENL